MLQQTGHCVEKNVMVSIVVARMHDERQVFAWYWRRRLDGLTALPYCAFVKKM
jgi:hypothetical protein